MKYDGIVDHRFAELIEDILNREWIVKTRLTQAQVARMLNVSRSTMYEWLNRKTNIAKSTAWPFRDHIGMQGYFARRVLEIHNENQMRKARALFEEEQCYEQQKTI